MGTDEQDKVVVETIREKDDLRRSVGIKDKVLDDFATELKKFADEILEYAKDQRSAFSSFSTLHKYIDFSKAIDLATERRSDSQRLQATIRHLANMGIDLRP